MRGVDWSPDGAHLASAGLDGLVRVWRVEDGAWIGTLAVGEGCTSAVPACKHLSHNYDHLLLLQGHGDAKLQSACVVWSPVATTCLAAQAQTAAAGCGSVLCRELRVRGAVRVVQVGCGRWRAAVAS